jgi:hypothetical protein
MARCARCNAETQLYDGGTPVCLGCSKEQEPQRKLTSADLETTAALVQRIADATEQVNAAFEAFNAIVTEIPSLLPRPDGAKRIQDAARELSVARKEMMTAHTRLNEFVGHGIVPPDLKQDRKRSG